MITSIFPDCDQPDGPLLERGHDLPVAVVQEAFQHLQPASRLPGRLRQPVLDQLHPRGRSEVLRPDQRSG